MTNSCPGGWKCNCDQNDETWRGDSGYLTDKNTLPVSEMRFGDADTPIAKSPDFIHSENCDVGVRVEQRNCIFREMN